MPDLFSQASLIVTNSSWKIHCPIVGKKRGRRRESAGFLPDGEGYRQRQPQLNSCFLISKEGPGSVTSETPPCSSTNSSLIWEQTLFYVHPPAFYIIYCQTHKLFHSL